MVDPFHFVCSFLVLKIQVLVKPKPFRFSIGNFQITGTYDTGVSVLNMVRRITYTMIELRLRVCIRVGTSTSVTRVCQFPIQILRSPLFSQRVDPETGIPTVSSVVHLTEYQGTEPRPRGMVCEDDSLHDPSWLSSRSLLAKRTKKTARLHRP